mgnify:CR=1 FL=1
MMRRPPFWFVLQSLLLVVLAATARWYWLAAVAFLTGINVGAAWQQRIERLKAGVKVSADG